MGEITWQNELFNFSMAINQGERKIKVFFLNLDVSTTEND